MVSREMTITNAIGLHARPATILVNTSKAFKSVTTVQKDGQSAPINSIVSLMKLHVKKGDIITLVSEGPDEEEAMRAFAALIESKFGEE